jgi:hypothetical protein
MAWTRGTSGVIKPWGLSSSAGNIKETPGKRPWRMGAWQFGFI